MKKLYIFKTGHSYKDTLPLVGDFEQMVIQQSGISAEQVGVIDVLEGDELPNFEDCAGVVITGSHAMVTDNLPWSLAIEVWLRGSVEYKIPVLGICYGHQLIAKAFNGVVDYHPQGIEVGTVPIELVSAAHSDPLFKFLPQQFSAHATHSQSVRKLPEGAVHLAQNDFEGHHAFRIGDCIWGVQFHPEFNAEVMKPYIDRQRQSIEKSGHNRETLLRMVSETPQANHLLHCFVTYCF